MERKEIVVTRRLRERLTERYHNVRVKVDEVQYEESFRISETQLEAIAPPKWGNYFDLRGGNITFSRGKPELNEDGKWKRDGRQMCRSSKLVNYIIQEMDWSFLNYPDTVKTRMLNRLNELVSLHVKGAEYMDIQISDKIGEIYNLPTAHHTGTLDDSCMRREADYECSNYAGTYDLFGENVSIAYVVNDDGELVARALLWHNVISEDGNIEFNFMDRVYGSENAIKFFIDWAMENGYYVKEQQRYGYPTLVNADGDEIPHYTLQINHLERSDIPGTPFIDTFEFINFYHNRTVLSTNKISGDYLGCHSCDGNVSCICENCGEVIYGTDEVCYVDDSPCCEECVTWSDYYRQYILQNDSVYSSHVCSDILEREAVEVENVGWVPSNDSDIVEVDGRLYLTDDEDIFWCEECYDYHLASEMHDFDNRMVCEECFYTLEQERIENETEMEESIV